MTISNPDLISTNSEQGFIQQYDPEKSTFQNELDFNMSNSH